MVFVLTRDLVWAKTDYVFDADGYEKVVIPVSEGFTVLNKVLLQQLWNKIFCGDIIREQRLRFDESQSMGEDFSSYWIIWKRRSVINMLL